MNAWDYAEILAPRNQPPPKRRWPRPKRLFLAAAALLVGLTSGLALAGTCTAILPAPMVTLCPGQPALAADLNTNFSQMITWVEQKLGPVSNKDSTMQRIIPSYAAWSAAAVGTANGGAAIVNDNTSYQALMVVGNTSAGGVHKLNLYDDVQIERNAVVKGALTADSLATNTPVTGAVLGGFYSNCNGNSTVQRSCTAWGVASCGSACNGGSCSKGTRRDEFGGFCYNTTDGSGAFCYSALCVQ